MFNPTTKSRKQNQCFVPVECVICQCPVLHINQMYKLKSFKKKRFPTTARFNGELHDEEKVLLML